MRPLHVITLVSCLAMGALEGWAQGDDQAKIEMPVFTDVTGEAGISFEHRFGDYELTNIVEATGAGAAFFDYDNDGYLDIYLVNGAWNKAINDNRGREMQGKLFNRLYHNERNGRFTDATESAGVGDTGFGFGCSAADYDNDGDVDLYVLNYGPNVLYRNDGDGTFTDDTEKSGLGDPRLSLSAPWLDYDRDGDLDVYVANYLEYDEGKFRSFYAADGYPGPLSYAAQPDALYRNNGDGTFTEVTEETGVASPNGRAMSATASDVNNDGWLDIYVANDATANFYYENQKNGTFEEKGLFLGLAFGENGQGVSSMGPFFADVDRNGLQDVFIPDMGFSSLLMNEDNFYVDRTRQSNVAVASGQYTGWAGLLFDYDNDGFVDIFVANGNAHHEFTEEDVLLRNSGDGKFIDVSAQSGDYFRTKHVGRGATCGDYDNDGDMDLLVVNLNSEAKLLRNDGGNRNNWITIEAKLPGPERDAIGARVTVSTGPFRQIQDLVPVRGYMSQLDSRLHFGLLKADRVDAVEIRWPNGETQKLENLPVNQVLKVVYKAR